MDKVLLVGINAYPSSPLNGCVNDIQDMAEFLVSQYSIPHESIKMLADERATKVNIIEGLKWLCSGLQSGDRIIFHYSGHGTQVPDMTGTEVDGLSECICPVDFAWDPNHYITDKELVAIFSTIPSGVKFNWLSDSCHSGDLTRDEKKKKFILPPVDVAWNIKIANKKKLKSKSITNGILDVGFLSGCQPAQTSADAFINGRYNGAFTYYFLQVMKTMKDKPLTKVAEEMRDQLKKNRYDQQPQAEGNQASSPFC